jgi:hypothetical protein
MALQELSIFVNSAIDRFVDETTTSFSVSIDQVIATRNSIKMRLNQIEVPNTQPTFPFHAYIFYYEISGNLFDIELNEQRNYTSGTEVATDLSNGFASNGHDIGISFSTTTNRFTFTNNEASDTFRPVGSYRYSDRLAETPSNVADRLGLTQNTTSVSLSNAETITCDDLPRLLPTNAYYLVCREITKSGNTIIPDRNYTTEGAIVGRITAGGYGTLSQLSFSQEQEYLLPQTTINRLRFTLLDDEFYPVSASSVPITFNLMLTIS